MQVKKIIVLSFNSIKHKNNKFHFVIIKGQQRNVPKTVFHVQSCSFAYLNFLFSWTRLVLKSCVR